MGGGMGGGMQQNRMGGGMGGGMQQNRMGGMQQGGGSMFTMSGDSNNLMSSGGLTPQGLPGTNMPQAGAAPAQPDDKKSVFKPFF